MDKKERQRLLTIAATAVVSVCLIILFYFAVKRHSGLKEAIATLNLILRPFFLGGVMAFLMNPIMKFFERHMKPFFIKRCKTVVAGAKVTRTISSLLSLVVFIGIVAVFMIVVIPEMYSTIKFLVNNITEQIMGVLDWANDITRGHFEKEIMGAKKSGVDQAIETAMTWIRDNINLGEETIVKTVVAGAYNVGKLFVDFIIAIIVSVYILCSKERFCGQIKKIIYAVCAPKTGNTIVDIFRKAHEVFYGFIVGKIIDSIIIGIICYVCMLILNMPYAVLVSVIIGVTNIIPVFGPYIGAVPTVIIIFLTSPMQGIYFLIFVFVLQQIDGNIIGPKILGDSTGLSSFWVVFAIVVGGGLFGFLGMIIGVPTMALIYYLIGKFVEYLLRKKQLPEDTKSYISLERIEPESKELKMHDEIQTQRKQMVLFQKKSRQKDMKK